MSERIVLVNGRPLSMDSAAILPLDRGFTLGDGVFESLRSYAGRPFLLAKHLERLTAGASALRILLPFSPDDLTSQVNAILRANGLESVDAYLRITLTRGPAERGLQPPAEPHPTLILVALPLTALLPAPARRGRIAIIARTVRRNEQSPACRWKTVSQVDHVLATIEAEERGADEALLLNSAGQLAEGTTTNIFWVSAGRLITPSLACGILPGVTRAAVIEIAKRNRLEVEDGNYTPQSLLEAREAFLTSSLIEIEPLIRVEDRIVGSGSVGPTTLSLMEHLERSRLRGEGA